jgi:hypothetical protein
MFVHISIICHNQHKSGSSKKHHLIRDASYRWRPKPFGTGCCSRPCYVPIVRGDAPGRSEGIASISMQASNFVRVASGKKTGVFEMCHFEGLSV